MVGGVLGRMRTSRHLRTGIAALALGSSSFAALAAAAPEKLARNRPEPARASPAAPAPAASGLFETKIRPLLAGKCYSCHGPQVQMSGLRLDSREAMLKGGKTGPALLLANPD